jgi:hypothetical protein
MHPLVVMLRDERVLLGKLAESAHRCGIEERLLRQVELDGTLIAKLIHAILSDPELGLGPASWHYRPHCRATTSPSPGSSRSPP